MPNIYSFTDTRWSASGTTYNGIFLTLSNGSGGTAVGAAASRPIKISNNGTDIFNLSLAGVVYTNGQIISTVGAVTSPVTTSEVCGAGIQISGTGFANAAFTQSHTTYNGLYFGYDSGTQKGLIFGASNTPASSLGFWTLNAGGNWGERYTINSDGSIRLSSYGAGALTTDASGNVTAVSDIRYKDVQGDYTKGLELLTKINPIMYKWNKESGLELEHTYIGFSAQNIYEHMPLATGKNSEGMLSIQDRALLAIIVNSIKELNGRINNEH